MTKGSGSISKTTLALDIWLHNFHRPGLKNETQAPRRAKEHRAKEVLVRRDARHDLVDVRQHQRKADGRSDKTSEHSKKGGKEQGHKCTQCSPPNDSQTVSSL